MFDTVPAEWVAEFAQSGAGGAPSRPRVDPPFAPSTDSDVAREFLSALSERVKVDAFAHYVSSVDGRRILLLAGPFSSAAEARGWIESTRTVLIDLGRITAALNLRVTRIVTRRGLSRSGDLNDLLGICAPR